MKEVTMRYFTSGEELEAFLLGKIEEAVKLNIIESNFLEKYMKRNSEKTDESTKQENTTP